MSASFLQKVDFWPEAIAPASGGAPCPAPETSLLERGERSRRENAHDRYGAVQAAASPARADSGAAAAVPLCHGRHRPGTGAAGIVAGGDADDRVLGRRGADLSRPLPVHDPAIDAAADTPARGGAG